MKRGLSLLLTLALSLSVIGMVKADDLKDSQKKLQDVNNSISEKKDKIEEIDKNKKTAENEIGNIDAVLNKGYEKLGNINNQINDIDNSVQGYANEIQVAEESLQKENDLFKSRVRALYTEGNRGYLEVLLEADSFSDMISRMDYIKTIMEYDKNLVKNIQSNKDLLKEKKAELEKGKIAITSLKEEQTKETEALEAKSADKKNLIKSLEKDKEKYKSLLAQEESESAQIGERIKKLKDVPKTQTPAKPVQTSNPQAPSKSNSNGKLFCVTGKGYVITSPYGWRVHPVLGTKRFHAGIDIGVFSGTPIYALTDGVVIASEWMSGYGNVVMINHGDITSIYAHNSSLQVKVGQTVKGGQLISYSGNTGLSSGPHLHFEIRLSNGQTVDPMSYYIR